mgnify:FL=1
MISGKVKKQINAAVNELEMNLSNNYKDLAHKALKDLDILIKQMYNDGSLKEKDFIKMSAKVDEYKRQMAGYHH